MLVLTRKPGEKILIGDDIVITVLDARGESIRIGIDAPRGVKIQRDEVLRAVTEANLEAARADSAAEARILASLGLTPAAPPAPVAQETDAATAAATPAPRPHPPVAEA